MEHNQDPMLEDMVNQVHHRQYSDSTRKVIGNKEIEGGELVLKSGDRYARGYLRVRLHGHVLSQF